MKRMKSYSLKVTLFALFVLTSFTCFAQGKILLLSDQDCEVVVNGTIEQQLNSGVPQALQLPYGEHYIQAKTSEQQVVEIVNVQNEQQKIVRLHFSEERENPQREEASKASGVLSPLQVIQVDLKLIGGVYELSDELNASQGTPELFYAFAAEDEVIINADIKNKKGKFFIKMYSYPDGQLIYSRKKLKALNEERIKIKKAGIYRFQVGTAALFDKRLSLMIERQPASPAMIDWNPEVVQKYKFETIEVEKSFHYVNSISNETFRGGTNEIAIPVNLPKGTVEWYYSFSASRSKSEVRANMKKGGLAKKLVKALSKTSSTSTVINIGVDLLMAPPGANYCDVYLFDHYNMQRFRRDSDYVKYITEGSRENLKSSTIKVTCCTDDQPYYLGIENDSDLHGIHVGLEIIAIKRTAYLEQAID